MPEDSSFQMETWDFKAGCHTAVIWLNKQSNEISSLAAGTNAVVRFFPGWIDFFPSTVGCSKYAESCQESHPTGKSL